MKDSSTAVLLLTVLVLLASALIHTSAQERLTASISPSSISVKPGERVSLILTIRNMGDEPINVTGIRLSVLSERMFGVSLETGLGEYPIPFEKSVKVDPGQEKPIKRTVEVPRVPLAGDFRIRIAVETTGGIAYTQLKVHMGYTTGARLLLLLLVLIVFSLIYLIYRTIKGRISKKKRTKKRISRAEELIKKRDKYTKLLNKLEEERSEGRVDEEGYRKLRDEYESRISGVQEELERLLPLLNEDIKRVTSEVSKLEDGVRELKARMSVGEISKRAAMSRIKQKEKMMKEKKNFLSEMKVLVNRIRNGRG